MKSFKILLLLFFLSAPLLGQQAVQVTTSLVPPYSTRLSDYANQPGKVLITLRNTQTRVVNLYLRLQITGDNGIQVLTNPTFRASRAITLQANAVATVTLADLQTLFDLNSFIIRGTSLSQIEQQNGLPEGTYSICVRAFDFTRQEFPLSPDSPLGCTTIRLTQLEPPLLIKPFADEVVQVQTPQNQIFLWSPPAGSPAGTQFQLKIVEMFDPNRNPNDAFLARTNPPFFEKIVSGTTYLYGPADPPMVEGRKYAWAVTALDRVLAGRGRVVSEGSAYRNDGRSEIRSFVYGKVRIHSGIQAPVFATPKKKEEKPLNPLALDPNLQLQKLMTTVSGRLFFNFPEDLKLKSTGFLDDTQYPDITVKASVGNSFKIRSIDHIQPNLLSKPLQKIKVTLLQAFVIPLSGSGQTMENYKNHFEFQSISPGWGLVTAVRNVDKPGGNQVVSAFSIQGKSLTNQDLVLPIATGMTDDEGGFSFSFLQTDTLKTEKVDILQYNTQLSQASLQKVLLLKVDNPYYNSPLILMNPVPGETLQLPDLVSTVRSFSLDLITKNDGNAGQMGGGNGGLENIQVEFLRLRHANKGLPQEEGQNLPPSAKDALKIEPGFWITPAKIERVVFRGKTDNKGTVRINRLIGLGNASERFVAHAYSDENIGVYSKIDSWRVYDLQSHGQFNVQQEVGKAILVQTLQLADLSFNFMHRHITYQTEVILPSAPAVIKGKAVENNLPISDVMAVLKRRTKNFINGTAKAVAYSGTDADGYFEFKNVDPGDYIIEFVKEGYKLARFDGNVSSQNQEYEEITFNVEKYFSILFGQLLQTNEIKMVPEGILAGCVRDEDGNVLVADLKIGHSTVHKSIENPNAKDVEGCFFFSAPSGPQKIQILPRSLEYFPEEILFTIKETGITTIPKGKLVVYRKKHRMIFTVQAKSMSDIGKPVAQAYVTVNGKEYVTGPNGQVLVEFESPGTHFLVKVKPSLQDNLAVWEKEIAIPVSKVPSSFEIFLEPSKQLFATVTEVENGVVKPSQGARVYIKSLGKTWGNSTSTFAECFTDEKGNCLLRGIPQAENNIQVYVMKDAGTIQQAQMLELKKTGKANLNINPNISLGEKQGGSSSAQDFNKGSYVGEQKMVVWPTGQAQATLNLQLKFEKGFFIQDIWGFPVKIEKVQPGDQGSLLVSGYLYNLPDNPAFRVVDKGMRLDFNQVKMVKSNASTNSHEPVGKEISIVQGGFPVTIGTQLQGKVTPSAGTLNPLLLPKIPKIKVRRTTQGGEIVGAVELRLSSFEGAYQFSGKFNLAENNHPSQVVVFQSGGNAASRKLQIGTAVASDKIESAHYKVHGFSASSDLKKSYVQGDSVKIFTVLHTQIPEMEPADMALPAGYITVLPSTILPFEGGDEIGFLLEKWKVNGLKSQGNAAVWTFDKFNGGIRIPQVLINTGLISILLKQVIIQPNKLIIDPQNLDQQNAKAFTLGGMIPLEITPGATARFSYDPNAYHDNKPHWKFSLSSPNGTQAAATISQLDGLAKGQKLEFGTMNLFSDNQQQLNSPSNALLRFFDVLDFKLNTIDVGPNAFTMVGNASMNIPNMRSQTPQTEGVVGQIVYGKSASGQIKATLKPLFFTIEGKGQVRFDASDLVNAQQLSPGKFTSKGRLTIYDTQSGKNFAVDALLTHSKSGNTYSTHIVVEPNQKVPLENKYLSIKPGLEHSSMAVVGKDWQNLRLTTVMPLGGSGGFQQLLENEKDRTLVFVVKGAIETDPSSGAVGIKGMNTGVGGLSLYYNFDRQEVRGQFLFSPPVPVVCGLFNLNSANISMTIGSNGMYMMTNGVGDVALAGLPLPLTVGYSFVGGYYTQPMYPEDQSIFLSLAVKKSLPVEFQQNIQGMLLSSALSVEPFNEDYEIYNDVLKTGAKGKVVAGVAAEYRSFIRYNEGTSATIFAGNYAYGGLSIDAAATLLAVGVYAGSHVNVQIATEGSIQTPNFLNGLEDVKNSLQKLKLEGCGSITMGVYLGAVTPLGDVGWDIEKTISARAGYQNNRPFLKFSLDECGNAMPSDKIKHSFEKQ